MHPLHKSLQHELVCLEGACRYIPVHDASGGMDERDRCTADSFSHGRLKEVGLKHEPIFAKLESHVVTSRDKEINILCIVQHCLWVESLVDPENGRLFRSPVRSGSLGDNEPLPALRIYILAPLV